MNIGKLVYDVSQCEHDHWHVFIRRTPSETTIVHVADESMIVALCKATSKLQELILGCKNSNDLIEIDK